MKNLVLILTVTALFTGCTSARLSRISRPDGRYSPAIYAAASIDFSSDRTSTLGDIAAKPDLTEAEQIYLLEVLRVTCGFSADKRDVLLALLNNPAVTDASRSKVADILPKLDLFPKDAKQVVDALVG